MPKGILRKIVSRPGSGTAEVTRQPGHASSLEDLLQQPSSLPHEVRLNLLVQVAEQIALLHQRGHTHRALDADHVTVDASGRPQLTLGPESRSFGGGCSDAEYCPPELAVNRPVAVPAGIDAAHRTLHAAGVGCDPRRIDVYQLGSLGVRLFCGIPVREYLRSPKAKARLPAELHAVVDGALGYCPATRLHTAEQVLEHLSACTGVRTDGSTKRAMPTTDADDNGPERVAEDASDLPFEQLGPYHVVRRIGRGGMGDVYLGYDETLERFAAIKVLLPALTCDEASVRRFAAEAAAMAQINHPNIVPVYSIGEENGRHFFAMQYVAGESLAEQLSRRGRLGVDETVDVLRQCLEGLEVAHAQGLIHRDIKPGNILLDRNSGRALLVDFGLVHRLNSDRRVTVAGMIMGTVDYIAPEQATGRPVDARADLYALGVLTYQMLSGEMPYRGDTPTAVIYQHAHEEPIPLSATASNVPAPLCHIVMRMMARRPEDRYQNCAEALTDLRAFCDGRPLAAFPSQPSAQPIAETGPAVDDDDRPAPLRGRWTAAVWPKAVAVGAVVLGIVLTLALWPEAKVQPPSATGAPSAADAQGWLDLLSRVKLKADIEQGHWRRDRDGLHAEWGQASRLLLPVRIEGDYSLEVEFTSNAGTGSIVVVFPVAARSCQLTLHGWEGLDGLELIEGRRANNNPTTKPSRVESLQRYLVRIDVRLQGEQAAIDVLLDGQPHLHWRGPQASLDTCLEWSLSDESRPALGVSDVDATFHSVRYLNRRSE
jgi:serine/threonine protein kinase